jgi:hypothetical protein
MSILLEIVDQTDTVIAEMRAREARLKAFITQLLDNKLGPGISPTILVQDRTPRFCSYRKVKKRGFSTLTGIPYPTGQQELAANLIKNEEPIPTNALKNQGPYVLVIGHVLGVDVECIE